MKFPRLQEQREEENVIGFRIESLGIALSEGKSQEERKLRKTSNVKYLSIPSY